MQDDQKGKCKGQGVAVSPSPPSSAALCCISVLFAKGECSEAGAMKEQVWMQAEEPREQLLTGMEAKHSGGYQNQVATGCSQSACSLRWDRNHPGCSLGNNNGLEAASRHRSWAGGAGNLILPKR